jgi:hypothetical protein
MDSDFKQALHLASEKAVLKRMDGVKALHRRMNQGCWLSRLALEYLLEHDPNSAIRNRCLLVFKRSSISPRENFWEKHFGF